jgi:cytidyltransferase-like protein
MKFNLVAVAGTFDHLHLGHQKLIQTAKKSGRKILIGLCQKSMLVNKVYPESLENYTTRKKSVDKFNPDQIIPLSDIYGPAVTSSKIDAIICSPLTRLNAEKINHLRHLNKLNYLDIIEVPLIKCADGQPLSSTLIRQGLVNRQGLVYKNLFNKTLTLSPANRKFFQKPFGLIVKKIRAKTNFTVTIGDIATLSLLKEKITPNLAIVDLKTKRQLVFSNLASLGLKPGLTVNNPASTITPDLADKILSCLAQKIPTLLVNGEEDLAVLPAILLSPLKTEIYYGQPNVGLVKITVTEKTKEKALKYLKNLTQVM